MSRKQATPEQREKAQANREKFKVLCQRVAAMTEDQRAELASRMPIVTCEGHTISPYNACLILSQFQGTPTIVGGFQQWRKHGRKIVSGPGSGLMIWCPTGRKGKGADSPTADVDNDKPSFIPGYVFDITQTADISAGSESNGESN